MQFADQLVVVFRVSDCQSDKVASLHVFLFSAVAYDDILLKELFGKFGRSESVCHLTQEIVCL